MDDKRRGLRAFATALVATLCVLGFVIGFLEVDEQSRRIGFGDEKTLIFTITGQNWRLPW